MGFSRLEYWSGLPCPPPWDLSDSGIQPSPRYCRRILYNWPTRGAPLLFSWGPSNSRFDPFLSLSSLLSPFFSPLSFYLSLSLLLSECVGRGCGGWGAVPWKESKTSPSVLAGTQPSITCAGVKSQKAATVWLSDAWTFPSPSCFRFITPNQPSTVAVPTICRSLIKLLSLI